MRFRVTYGDPDALLEDVAQQFERGGFLARVGPDAPPRLFEEADLVLVFGGRRARLRGRVVQVIPEVGVALSFEDVSALAPLLADARARTGSGGPAPVHTLDADGAEDVGAAAEAPGRARPLEAHQRVREASRPEKIRLARHGSRDERMLVLRGGDPTLQRLVLKNPGLTLDEVRTIAGMSAVPVDVLKSIAEHAEWSARPEIALALVRNPKTPVPLAIRLVGHVSMGDLRTLAKSQSLRTPVLHAVRRKVVG